MRFFLPLLLILMFSTPSYAADIETLKIEGVGLEMTLGDAEEELKGQGYVLLERERGVVRYIKQDVFLISLEADRFIDSDLREPEAEALRLTYIQYNENVPSIIKDTPDEPYDCLVGKEFYKRACTDVPGSVCEAQGGLRGMQVKPVTSRADGPTYGMDIIVRTNKVCQINLREYRAMNIETIYKYQRRKSYGQKASQD